MSRKESTTVDTSLTQDLQILESIVKNFTVKKVEKLERTTRKTKAGDTVKNPIEWRVTATNPMPGTSDDVVLIGTTGSLKIQLDLFKRLYPEAADLMTVRDYAEAQAKVEAMEQSLSNAKKERDQCKVQFDNAKRTRKLDSEVAQKTLRKIFQQHPAWAKVS